MPSWFVSSWSKILRASVSCALAFAAEDDVADDVVVGLDGVPLLPPDGVDVEGGVVDDGTVGVGPDGIADDGGIVVVVAVDGDVCASITWSADDAGAASAGVAHAVPPTVKIEEAAARESRQKRAFIAGPFIRKTAARSRQERSD